MKPIFIKFSQVLKNKTTVLVVFFGLASCIITAQTSDSLFVKANNFYQKGAYREAVDTYKKIESQSAVSTDLYFNLANTYYKLNEVAPAIYNYEKALQLDPNNQDARYNLAFANRMTIDKIDVLPKSFLQKMEDNYIRVFKYDTWALIAVVSSILFVLLFLSYYFSFISAKKRLYFIGAIVSLFVLVMSFAFAYSGHSYAKNNNPAIIFVLRAPVKDAPTPNSNTVFELHEGTKVLILEKVDTWQKIKLADGKIGWIDQNDLKAL